LRTHKRSIYWPTEVAPKNWTSC